MSNTKYEEWMCDNCGVIRAAECGSDCQCGGTHSMDPPTEEFNEWVRQRLVKLLAAEKERNNQPG